MRTLNGIVSKNGIVDAHADGTWWRLRRWRRRIFARKQIRIDFASLEPRFHLSGAGRT